MVGDFYSYFIKETDLKKEMSSYLPKIGWKSWALGPSDPKNDAISIISLCVILSVTLTIAII